MEAPNSQKHALLQLFILVQIVLKNLLIRCVDRLRFPIEKPPIFIVVMRLYNFDDIFLRSILHRLDIRTKLEERPSFWGLKFALSILKVDRFFGIIWAKGV